jgi:hypothetical protein
METNLRDALTAILPAYMVPCRYVFCDQFPHTPTGKVDRRAFQVIYNGKTKTRHHKPNTEKEKILARVWAELFDIPINSISVEDNFFSLGGDSILVGQAVLLASELGHDSSKLNMAPVCPESVGF